MLTHHQQSRLDNQPPFWWLVALLLGIGLPLAVLLFTDDLVELFR